MTSPRRWLALSACLLLAGCATTIAGRAEPGGGTPIPPSSLTDTTRVTDTAETSENTATSETETSETETSETETSETETSQTETSQTETSQTESTSDGSDSSTDISLGDDGAVLVGDLKAKVVIDVYVEPLCPPCATFAQDYGKTLDAAAQQGKALVRYRFANFLDSRSASKDYSTRAIAALLTVLAYDRDAAIYLKFQEALMSPTTQPQEDGAKDLTDQQLGTMAGAAGASDVTVKAIVQGVAGKAATTLAKLTETRMKQRSISGTPAVEVNGKVANVNEPNWLDKALGG